MSLWDKEPTVILEAVRSILIALATLGLTITNDQIDAIVGLLGGVLAVAVSFGIAKANREQVYPAVEVERYRLDAETVIGKDRG